MILKLCPTMISLNVNPISAVVDYAINEITLQTTNLTLPSYNITPSNCIVSLTYSLVYISGPGYPSSPSWITTSTSKI